jgi:hypothetical protein
LDKAIERMDVVKNKGLNLLYDGAKDSNGKSLEQFALQAADQKVLLCSSFPQVERKDTAWMVKTLESIITGTFNFATMSYPREDEEDTNQVVQPVVQPAVGSKRKKLASAADQLRSLFSLSSYIVAGGGDNAKVPVNATLETQRDFGILAWAYRFATCVKFPRSKPI